MHCFTRRLKRGRTMLSGPSEIVCNRFGLSCTSYRRNPVLRPGKCLQFLLVPINATCYLPDPLLLSDMHIAVLLFMPLLDRVAFDSVGRIRKSRNFARDKVFPSPILISSVSLPFLFFSPIPSFPFPFIFQEETENKGKASPASSPFYSASRK